MTANVHIPVLLEEVLQNLVSVDDGYFVDATLGGGGHALHMLSEHEKLHVIGIDADGAALAIAKEALKDYKDRVTLVRGNFRDLKTILKEAGVSSINGILFDIGISTYQMSGNRGFSFNDEVRLDMRMDDRENLTAYEVVNGYSLEALERVLFTYGEEEKSRRIARAIIEARKKKPVETARELGDLVAKIKWRKGRTHPATKTFQAIRIETNRELESLKNGLDGAIEMLNTAGRIAVITFHSLEDRMVKETFRSTATLRVLTKKPMRPGRSEVLSNPRSRSAKLRVAEKL